jgi:hypothetical protein
MDGLLDHAVEQAEQLGREERGIAHRPVVRVKHCQQYMHSARMDTGPGHERQEGDV